MRVFVVTALAGLVVTLLPRAAEAQLTGGSPVTLAGNYPLRVHGSTPSARAPRSDDDFAPNTGINRADCESDETWRWSFALPVIDFSYLDVWASASNVACAPETARAVTPPGAQQPAATCWRVARFPYGQVINGQVVSTKTTDMIKAAYQLENQDDPTKTTAKQICEPTVDMLPTRFFLHFLLVGADGVTVAPDAASAESSYDTTYDLAGPPPPDSIALRAGASLLVASWPAQTFTDKDFVGYRAYCSPISARPDGGTTCSPPAALAKGSLPTPELDALECGRSGTLGGSQMQIDRLTAGTTYAVAIAALDLYGNTGPLSEVQCLAPMAAPDAGADPPAISGGGVSCTVAHGAARAPLAAIAALAAIAGLLARGRPRRA